MKKRADGLWQRKVRINGKDKVFYSSEPTERKAIKDIENKIIEYKSKDHKQKHNFKMIGEKMLSEKEKTVSYNTHYNYTIQFSKMKCFYDQDIETITSKDVQNLINSLADKGYSKASLQKFKNVLNLIFKFAAYNQINVSYISELVKIPTQAPQKKRHSVDDECIKIITENVSPKDFSMWPFMLLYTGLRRGELAALKRSDVDLKNRIIKITKSVQFINDRPVVKNSPKTESGIREVPILDIVYEPLKKYIAKMKPDEFLFGGEKPYSLIMIRRRWNNYCKKNDISITQHQLRHSYALILFKAGVDPKTAQGLLGHANFQTTMNIYTDFSKDVTAESVNKINNMISKMK